MSTRSERPEIMLGSGFRHLHVVAGTALVGIVSLRDLLSLRIRRPPVVARSCGSTLWLGRAPFRRAGRGRACMRNTESRAPLAAWRIAHLG
jgi:hypothetical protein